jgi:hypothetical protein
MLFTSLSDGSSRTLTGGAGVAYGDRYIIYIGGVNYDRFLSAIDRPRQIQKAKEEKDESLLTRLQSEALSYMLHPWNGIDLIRIYWFMIQN